jgi:DNA invertase Pin-like site-specific DNA recombinase
MRVSTDHQTNENQRLRIEEFCNSHNWDLVKIYQDEESGSKRNRPGLDEMIRDSRRDDFGKVVAVKVDRIARSLGDLLDIAGRLSEYAVSLSFTDQDIDISSSQGKLMFQILGAFAEWEREMIIERTKAGMRRAQKQGKKIGRPKINGMTKQKVIDLRKEGYSYSVIQKETGLSKGKISQILTVHKGLMKKRGVSPIENGDVHKTEVI